MATVDALLEAAGRALSRVLGGPIALGDPLVLEGDGLVVRAVVSTSDGAPTGPRRTPSSVIVKKVSDTTFDQPGHDGLPQRFLNEWVCLEFLTSLGLGGEVCPRLVCADGEEGVLVVGDLGDLPTLQRILLAEPSSLAGEAMVEMGRALGRMQATARGREPEFRRAQVARGTDSPRCDSTVDQREREHVFLGCLEQLGLPPEPGFWEGVARLESSVHDDTPFWTMIHADAGPQNALVGERGVSLVDFEFGVYRNGLCDVVGARLGFPQTGRAMTVPEAHAAHLEQAYRETVSASIGAASDDDSFFFGLTAAAGHWALNRWAGTWADWVVPLLARRDREPSESDLEPVSRTLLVLDGFVALARESGVFPQVAGTVSGFAEEMRRRWPRLRTPPPYPALRNGCG